MNKISRKILFWLRDEVELWRQDGLVSAEQAARIGERYHLSTLPDRGIRLKLITIFSLLGALLIGTGIILFIAANWNAIPRSVRLANIILLIAAVNYVGYDLAFVRKNYPRIGTALLFLAALQFGAAIWLVAQTFHITSRYHNGVLFWALGILPVAWLLGMESILVLSSALLTVWTLWKSGDFGIVNYPYFVLMIALVLPLCYRHEAKRALFASLAGITLWFGFGPCAVYFSGSRAESMIAVSFLFFGLLLYVTGMLHSLYRRFKGYEFVYKFIGIVLLFGFTYFLSFKDVVDGVLPVLFSSTAFSILFGIFVFMISGTGLFLAMRRKRTPAGSTKAAQIENSAIVIVLLFLILVPFPAVVMKVILANLLLLALTIGTVALGYFRERAYLINMGFLFFAIQFLTRYFDYVYRYLPRSLFFIVTGVLLIVLAAFMEKKRRHLIQEMKDVQ